MPRTISRLRYKAPPAPVAFHARNGGELSGRKLERKVYAYVNSQSNPRNVRLQVVVNPKARLPATGQTTIAPRKPFTLRDVVDPNGQALHGEIIYVFRNIKSNQVIYSLQELLHDHHLAQLPFIGKHSKPPVLRPDEWTPHCVITFPSPEQGHSAFRKLRELRKIHETYWDVSNPEWKKSPKMVRMKKIMDQRANMTADLCAVLHEQAKYEKKMIQEKEERSKKEGEYMDKKWAQIDALANAALKKEKEADNVKWLEHQIRSLTLQLKMKHNQNDKDQQRLKNAKNIQEIRLRKIQYAQRKAEQFKTMQESLAAKAAPANELGAEQKLDEMRKHAVLLRKAVANPDPTRSYEDHATDREILANQERDITALKEAFEAKSQSENRNHYIARSVLPPPLKKPFPTPFSVEDVRIQWADIQDAMHAAGKWPEVIEHESLEMNKAREGTVLMSREDFRVDRAREVGSILEAIELQGKSEPLRIGGSDEVTVRAA